MDKSELEQLPQYRSHKVVRAGKIMAIWFEDPDRIDDHGSNVLVVVSGLGYAKPVRLDISWFDKHEPRVGGYLVAYDDGYISFSPAKAFEEGYTLIEEDSWGMDTPVPDIAEDPPQVGMIVLYRLTKNEASSINGQNGVGNIRGAAAFSDMPLPMVVTRNDGAYVNGQVLLDGNGSFWAEGKLEGDGPGNWSWPT